MNVLAIETSGNNGSVALRVAEAFSMETLSNPLRFSHEIIREIDRLFDYAGISVQDLEQIIVNSGPGSFTGIRVGIASALGLGAALNIPVSAVSTFRILIECGGGESSEAITFLPSHEEFLLICRWERKDHAWIKTSEEKLIEVAFLEKEKSEKNLILLGPEASWLKNHVEESNQFDELDWEAVCPSAQIMLNNNILQSSVPLTPQEIKYIRPYQARSKKGDYVWP